MRHTTIITAILFLTACATPPAVSNESDPPLNNCDEFIGMADDETRQLYLLGWLDGVYTMTTSESFVEQTVIEYRTILPTLSTTVVNLCYDLISQDKLANVSNVMLELLNDGAQFLREQ